MDIKIENKSTAKLNLDKIINHINSVLETVPPAHLRGISKILLVDRLEDPRLDAAQRAEVPGLYHPRLPGSPPWLEIALETLRSDTTWYKRWGRRLTFKANLTATLLSLIGQHYYLTLSHGVRKTQYEAAVRSYVERQMTAYAESRRGIRAALLKPFKPVLDRLARWLRKRYLQEMKGSSDHRPVEARNRRVRPPRRRKKRRR